MDEGEQEEETRMTLNDWPGLGKVRKEPRSPKEVSKTSDGACAWSPGSFDTIANSVWQCVWNGELLIFSTVQPQPMGRRSSLALPNRLSSTYAPPHLVQTGRALEGSTRSVAHEWALR